jgi:hypothetical protein
MRPSAKERYTLIASVGGAEILTFLLCLLEEGIRMREAVQMVASVTIAFLLASKLWHISG